MAASLGGRQNHRDRRTGRSLRLRLAATCLNALLLSGCSGAQSALDPAGRGAERIAALFWWMAGGAAIVWLIVIGLALYALRGRRKPHDRRKTALFIIGGGVAFPTLTLAGLLSYGLAMMPELIAPAPDGSLTIRVSGERWWWRFEYEGPEGSFETANELRLPVDQPVQFILSSPDVIHAFWIPVLGPKIDMIPGRENRLALHPTRTGAFRGVCAEYCGASHALMGFDVFVVQPEAFEDWRRSQLQSARSPEPDTAAAAGERFFLQNGCAACHSVRGTPADGLVGPDLTHLASRKTIGASLLPNEPENLRRFLIDPEGVKPGVVMPHFKMLPDSELDALVAYLASLE